MGLGALHALEPGHGKTFLATYTIANEMDKKKVIKIISSMAISHTILLILLALLVPFFFPKIEESIHFYIQLIASLLILFVGVKMLVKSKSKHKHDHNCSCGHEHKENSVYKLDKPLNYTLKVNTLKLTNPNNLAETKEADNKNDNPIMVGFINGIMPCPSALAVVGMAFTYSSPWLISITMLAYVIGFIAAMFLMLAGFVVLKSKFLKVKSNDHVLQKRIELVSGIVISLCAFYYLFMAFYHTH